MKTIIFYIKDRIAAQMHRLQDFVIYHVLPNNKKQTGETKKINHKKHPPFNFTWRGLHLDVARHMVSTGYIKELIVSMHDLGLNMLHLHLSDDQGFRIEIKSYPRLHTIGSIRRETVIGKNFVPFTNIYKGDKTPYGGYYTQEELRDIVSFAKQYDITIVPEIDIPGHATAILAAYPEYAHSIPPKEVATYWGIFDNMLKADNITALFLEQVFTEVLDIFDSPHVHIGGDEVNVSGYDNFFLLDHISKYLVSKGRIPVVWDEAVDIAQKYNGVVMVWRSELELQDALRKKVKTVCALSSHLYFDYYQHPKTSKEPLAIGGYTPISKVKKIKPILEKYRFSPEGDYLIGSQAQMWTEYTKTEKDISYMIFPRLEVFSVTIGG